MARTITASDRDKLDDHGIERSTDDSPGAIDRYRDRWPWFDHVMRMNERYGDQGGNHFAAGITYFSVLSIFPLIMLGFATVAMVVAGNDELLDSIMDTVSESAGGELGNTLNDIIVQAIDQRGSVFGIGLVLALWTGLGWMGNLRLGVSEMWKVHGKADNFVKGKISDLIGLVGLLLALAVAFAVTAIGGGSFTGSVLDAVGLGDVPGIRFVTWFVALVVALVANWIVFFWLMLYLPRTRVPRPAAARAAVIGAVVFEVIKQFATVVFSNALSNPAGAAFGPVIGVMVVLYLVWRVTLYLAAWTATTPEALAAMIPEAPPAAVIRVRQEVRPGARNVGTAGLVGIGTAVGATAVGLLGRAFRRK
ncbi:YhjD/YihY/BrkB family envelope integrity protein [Corynebacterium sp.]|uniref:YhjD/YihY/BrkB family envelope integrity protein n=1 Tax=Corynebacterium sp. TaxID=1720 RepID=UPI0025C33B55|nr:YhjD/YihY/BrkB family envelope integrity protein [Corynebacterium sp.]